MRFKVSDRVKIKSLDWYNENKDEYGYVRCTDFLFTPEHSKYCGCEFTISHITEFQIPSYVMESNGHEWTDEMIEGLVEEETKNNNDMEEKETLLGWVKESNTLRLVPHKDYEIKPDGNNFYLVKKKKEYPNTFEECLNILGYEDIATHCIFHTREDERLFDTLYNLKVCRDAYWKIAGEEMGLGKPWEPDWTDETTPKFVINVIRDDIYCGSALVKNNAFAFPTEEMLDAFYENFKELINECKELL